MDGNVMQLRHGSCTQNSPWLVSQIISQLLRGLNPGAPPLEVDLFLCAQETAQVIGSDWVVRTTPLDRFSDDPPPSGSLAAVPDSTLLSF